MNGRAIKKSRPATTRSPQTAPPSYAPEATDEAARPVAEILAEVGRLRAENEQLRQSDALARLILDTVPEAMLVVDTQGRVVRANACANEVFGFPSGAMAGLGVETLIADPPRAGHGAQPQQATDTPRACALEPGPALLGRRHDGSRFPAEIGIGSMRMEALEFRVVSVTDISERKRHEEELRVAAIAFESQSGMMVTDPHGLILRVNQAFTRLTGYSAEEAVGQTPNLLSSGRHPPEFYKQMWDTITCKGYWQGQIWNRRKNGRIYAEWLTITAVTGGDGQISHYVSTFSDITQSSEADARIHRLVHYDALTELPNRRLLQDRLAQALATTTRHELFGAILFLDLDNFKTVNDTRGHDIGDQLLVEVTQRLLQGVRESDTVARLGGDEFVVLLEELGRDADEAAALAKQIGEKLGAAISQPILINGHEVHCTASIGVGLFHLRETVEELLKHGDLAMYHAKTAGRNTLRFFDPEMQARLDERSALESELRKAVQQHQLRLYYQPQVDDAGRIIGAETLLRWLHPQHGLIAPGDFIPLAEETGLILPIGHWVLATACAQLKAWSTSAHTRELMLAVNVSARQFKQADFVDQVKAVLEAGGANPARLKIELTESLVLDNVEDTIEKMCLLKTLGVSFSLDDFGTGHSSLAYLTRLPLDQLKIDRSFVLNLPDDINDGIIVKTIITMGRSLVLDVIAEGVETEGQREFLQLHGCHAFQGYLYAKPLPLEEFEELLANGAPKAAQNKA